MQSVTRPAEYIGQLDRTYVVAALLSESSRRYVQNIQDHLQKVLPESVWFMPAEALHVTVFELMQRGNFGVDKDLLYAHSKAKWESQLEDIFDETEALILRFATIEASPDAIILTAENPAPINDIRAQISAKLDLPTATKRPPDIVHCTIARYRKAIPLEQVQVAVQDFAPRLGLEESVDTLALVKTLRQPMLHYEILKKFLLK